MNLTVMDHPQIMQQSPIPSGAGFTAHFFHVGGSSGFPSSSGLGAQKSVTDQIINQYWSGM